MLKPGLAPEELLQVVGILFSGFWASYLLTSPILLNYVRPLHSLRLYLIECILVFFFFLLAEFTMKDVRGPRLLKRSCLTMALSFCVSLTMVTFFIAVHGGTITSFLPWNNDWFYTQVCQSIGNRLILSHLAAIWLGPVIMVGRILSLVVWRWLAKIRPVQFTYPVVPKPPRA